MHAASPSPESRLHVTHVVNLDVGITYWWHRSSRLRWLVNGFVLLTLLWLPGTLLYLVSQTTAAPILDGGNLMQVTIAWGVALLAGIGMGCAWEATSLEARETQRAAEIATIEEKQRVLCSRGDESEARVAEVLESVARELDPLAWVGSGMVMRYPESRPGQMTRFEVDNLLVTRFGIFLIEVKNWKHPVGIAPTGWSLDKPGGSEPVGSPLDQSAPKLRVLRKLVDSVYDGSADIALHSLAVLSHPQAHFPAMAPAEVLYLADLRYYLRAAYWRAQAHGLAMQAHVKRIRDGIDSMHDDTPTAKHDFMLELAMKKDDASGYLALENSKLLLQRQLSPNPRPYWANWRMYVPLAVCLLGELLFLNVRAAQALEKPVATAAPSVATHDAPTTTGIRKQRARHPR